MEAQKPTRVNASYLTLLTQLNALTKIPGLNDKHMKFIERHQIIVDGETITVPRHFRRGDFIEDYFVTKNFFFHGNFRGERKEKIQKIVADINVVEKTDHARGDKKTIILDIYPTADCYNTDQAESILAIGAPEGDIAIPNTSKFIAFKKKTKEEKQRKM